MQGFPRDRSPLEVVCHGAKHGVGLRIANADEVASRVFCGHKFAVDHPTGDALGVGDPVVHKRLGQGGIVAGGTPVVARTDDDGVLVLSEFAGAAKHLKGAMLVNPYDLEATTSAIQRALAMKPPEKKKRMRALRAEVMRLDVHRWADDYIHALEGD